jgi:enoyl-CoA hydratase/carnithine racemase
MMTKPASTVGSDSLKVQILDSGVVTITFNRPDRLNAVNWDLYREFVETLENISRDTSVPAVVITGVGRAFCAGGDISFMRQMYEGEIDKAEVQELQVRLFRTQMGMPAPTIAVVNGPAVGLGCTFALSCDLIYASERARFSDPHVQMGLVPGDGGALLWPLLVGPNKAKELLFTGDSLSVEEAHRLGLVNHLLPEDQLRDAALAFAERLARGPRATIQAIKSLTNQATRAIGEHFIRAGLAMESVSQESDYHHRAVDAFLAGKPVRF